MASTERTVRDAVVAAIRGISSSLGFDDAAGNVHDYLLNYEIPEKSSAYLSARVAGLRTERAWAVDVSSSEEVRALSPNSGANFNVERTYRVSVVGYYGMKPGGVVLNDLIDHARLVRGAIYGLTAKLSNTVDRYIGNRELQISLIRSQTENRPLFQGVMVFNYGKFEPDF